MSAMAAARSRHSAALSSQTALEYQRGDDSDGSKGQLSKRAESYPRFCHRRFVAVSVILVIVLARSTGHFAARESGGPPVPPSAAFAQKEGSTKHSRLRRPSAATIDKKENYFSSSSFKSKVQKAKPFQKFCFGSYVHTDLAPFIDKHAVKSFVKRVRPDMRIAEEFAHAERGSQITPSFLDGLPDDYLMKATHKHATGGILKKLGETVQCLSYDGAGGKLCKPQNRGESNAEYIRRVCDVFLSSSGGRGPYGQVKPRCIFEEFFPAFGLDFSDVKIHMFHGKPMFITLSHDGFDDHRLNTRTPDWREISATKVDIWGNSRARYDGWGERPAFLESMLEDAAALYAAVQEAVGNVAFVRVDFMAFNSSYAFAELTFHPDACRHYFSEPLADKFYGFVATHPDMNVPTSSIHEILRSL